MNRLLLVILVLTAACRTTVWHGLDASSAACSFDWSGARCIAQGQTYECMRRLTDTEEIWECAHADLR
jgi:hypothetical protein